jgi:hypothetical protein
VIHFLKEVFAPQETSLARFNAASFRAVARRLGITTPIEVLSEMNLTLEPASGAENLVLALCKSVGAQEYINPPGGVDLYSPDSFKNQCVKLTIQSFTHMTYACGRYTFVPGLSIVDVMMWNSPDQIKQYLDQLRTNGECSKQNG